MTYKARNLIILGSVLLLIILTTAYFLMIAYPGENQEVQTKLKNIFQMTLLFSENTTVKID